MTVDPDSSLTPPEGLLRACHALRIGVARAAWDQIGRYLARLLDANQHMNLTAVRDPEEAWNRHVLDSLSLLPFLGGAGRIIDVGSGGGLPGMILALARPDLQVTLLEATGKKCRFLEETISALSLRGVRVLSLRAEAAGRDPDHRERYDLAVARGLASLNVLIEYTVPLVRVGGRVLALKGTAAEDEVGTATAALQALGSEVVAAHDALPGVIDHARIVEIVKRQPTPEAYPRRDGVPSKRPLR